MAKIELNYNRCFSMTIRPLKTIFTFINFYTSALKQPHGHMYIWPLAPGAPKHGLYLGLDPFYGLVSVL